jgi:hypothetical protein
MVGAVVGVTVLGVSALGVTVGAVGTASASNSPAVQAACKQVSAVLSDGPDPDADPVGYAEAQILPLHQIKTSDKALKSAIDNLATTYQHFYKVDGKGAVKKAVTKASAKVNAICPGAAS